MGAQTIIYQRRADNSVAIVARFLDVNGFEDPLTVISEVQAMKWIQEQEKPFSYFAVNVYGDGVPGTAIYYPTEGEDGGVRWTSGSYYPKNPNMSDEFTPVQIANAIAHYNTIQKGVSWRDLGPTEQADLFRQAPQTYTVVEEA